MDEYRGEDIELLWWVVFMDFIDQEDRAGVAWWHRCTRPGFRHCLALRHDESGQVVGCNPLRQGLILSYEPGPALVHLETFAAHGATIVLVKTPLSAYDPALRTASIRGPMLTCASVVAYLIGVHGWIVTPRQLYRTILARYGGRLLWYRGEINGIS